MFVIKALLDAIDDFLAKFQALVDGFLDSSLELFWIEARLLVLLRLLVSWRFLLACSFLVRHLVLVLSVGWLLCLVS